MRGIFKYLIFIFVDFTRLYRRNGPSATSGRVYENEHHNLQEYTYKKITPCDVCSQVLRGKGNIARVNFRFKNAYF